MQRIMIAIVAAMLLVKPVSAETDWQSKALENVKTYDRVKDASWSDSGSLWLFAYKADVSWETVTHGFICMQLDLAGKPDGEDILVSWFEHGAALQGNSERLAQAWCD